MSIKEAIILIAAIVAGLGTILKWAEIVRGITKLVIGLLSWLNTFLFGNQRMLEQLIKVNTRLDEHGVMLKALDAETKYNGGSTIKDQLRAIRDNMLFMWATQESQNAALDLPIFYCGVDGRCTKASGPLATLFGMNQQDMLGYGWMVAVHPQDRESVAAAWRRTLVEGYPFDIDYRLLDGCVVHAVARPVTDAHGAMCGYHGVVRPHSPEEEDGHGNLQHRRRNTDL